MSLPAALRGALEARLEGVSRRDLAQRAARISEHYRRGEGTAAAIRDEADALAYAVARMPATYAATRRTLAHLAQHLPGFVPATVLDLGAGPGTATFAALDAWPGLADAGSDPAPAARLVLVEPHRALRTLAAALIRDAIGAAAPVDFGTGDVARQATCGQRADLVVMSYVLIEQPAAKAAAIAVGALAGAAGALLLVEPGTPAGFERLRVAREALIHAGARIVAPCPGAMRCPMADGDWCHFSVRLDRSRDHRMLKGADAPFEDERFCYLAVAPAADAVAASSKAGPEPAAARVLAEPDATRGASSLKLCTLTGLKRHSVTRADKAAWKRARRLAWGDATDA